MKASILTLCDYAKEYNGQMSIMGTFNVLQSIIFPAGINFCLASQFIVPINEAGEKKLSVSIRNKKTNIYLMPPQEFIINVNAPQKLNLEMDLVSNLILNFGNIQIPSEGTYIVELIGDSFKGEVEFYAVLATT